MKQIKISDATMRQVSEGFRLSFKEKIELSKLLDKLGVSFIELDGIKDARIDSLQIKSIAAAVGTSGIAVPVELNKESVEKTWSALREAKHPRLMVEAPASSVQVEYLFHKKPDALVSAVAETIKACRALCPDVEFVALDATRGEQELLTELLATAIDAGATTVTLCDTAGTMLPEELAAFVSRQAELLPTLADVTVGVASSNDIYMADASLIAAISKGAAQICAAAYPINNASLANIARVLAAKSDTLDANCAVNITQMSRIVEQITRLCQSGKGKAKIAGDEGESAGIFLTSHDDLAAVTIAVQKLGYDLSDDDMLKVFGAFKQIADKKQVSLKELDAIVASSAMQVPSTYKLDTYVITSGNTISATAHIKLTKNGQPVEGVYIGDGSIDAAFQAIEKITGCHYELDDFQLQAVTEGREAMGQTVVKLRSGGKVYSGSGISTDIVGAGIQAYLSAINKIIYEEEV